MRKLHLHFTIQGRVHTSLYSELWFGDCITDWWLFRVIMNIIINIMHVIILYIIIMQIQWSLNFASFAALVSRVLNMFYLIYHESSGKVLVVCDNWHSIPGYTLHSNFNVETLNLSFRTFKSINTCIAWLHEKHHEMNWSFHTKVKFYLNKNDTSVSEMKWPQLFIQKQSFT